MQESRSFSFVHAERVIRPHGLNLVVALILLLCSNLSWAQGHNEGPAPSKLIDLAFLVGNWSGKQNFHMENGQTMAADITNAISLEVQGRFIQEKTTTVVPGGRTGSAVHMLSYDPKANAYRVWWFNDTSPIPQSLKGTFDGTKLVMMTETADGSQGPTFRATYTKVSDTQLTYQLELKSGDAWRTLFVTEYAKKG